MKKIIYILLLSFPLNLFALDYNTAVKAMRDEMARNKKSLKMKNFDKPYFITYVLNDGTETEIISSLGALVQSKTDASYKNVFVSMRTGDYKFDNSGFGDTRPSVFSTGDGYDTIRHSLWLASNSTYLNALEKFSKKKAYKQQRNIKDEQPDFSDAPKTSFKEPQNTEFFDKEYFENISRLMSAEGEKYPVLKKFTAAIYYINEQKYYLDSFNDNYYQNKRFLEISLNAVLQTKDGYDINEMSSMVYASLKDIPDANELIKKAGEFAQKTSALYAAEKVESYIGPIWLNGNAAAWFIKNIFTPEIQNTKPVWQENGNTDYSAGSFAQLKNLRVISHDFNVYDDPSVKEYNGKTLAGYYKIDDEGVQGRKVNLVYRGKLTDILTTRSLIKNQKISNGHARGTWRAEPRAKVSNIFFEPQTPIKDLKVAFIKECTKLELEYCIKVENFGSSDNTFNAYKVYASDGREEPVYGAEISNLTTRSLRDIIYAGQDSAVYNAMPDGMPYSWITPSLIIAEAELKPTQKEASKPPMVKKP
jgi:predicted Zn-dependent protease